MLDPVRRKSFAELSCSSYVVFVMQDARAFRATMVYYRIYSVRVIKRERFMLCKNEIVVATPSLLDPVYQLFRSFAALICLL